MTDPAPPSGETRISLKVIREGPPPPCLETGQVLCRGCPGWTAMLTALKDPHAGWSIIHCPATGLTLSRRE